MLRCLHVKMLGGVDVSQMHIPASGKSQQVASDGKLHISEKSKFEQVARPGNGHVPDSAKLDLCVFRFDFHGALSKSCPYIILTDRMVFHHETFRLISATCA